MKQFLIGSIALAAMAAGACHGSGHACQDRASAAGSVLRLVRGLPWLQCRRRLVRCHARVHHAGRDHAERHHQRPRRHLRLPRGRAVAVGRLGRGRRSGAERLLPRMPEHQRRPARCPGLRAERVRRTQDHQSVHCRSAPRLRLGSIDDLRHRRLGVGQSQERPLLVHHQPLRRTRFHRQRRVAQQRVVCGRRLRLLGAQGRAGRHGPWRRISALRRERLAERSASIQAACRWRVRDFDAERPAAISCARA